MMEPWFVEFVLYIHIWFVFCAVHFVKTFVGVFSMKDEDSVVLLPSAETLSGTVRAEIVRYPRTPSAR